MDAYQQQHNRYMRPPQQPPPPPDPHHHYLHHQQPRAPVPPQGTWFSNQFLYHPQQPPPPSSHSPPPMSQQWAVPPPSSAYPSHPPPQPPPTHTYPSHHQFTQPPPLPPPRPQASTHPQISQSYPQVNQEWGNPNWGQHQQQQQGWDYPANNDAEDWAARARAWAAQKAAMEDQYNQSQFTQVGRMEEQSRFHEQYQQATDSQYQDFQQQQYPVPGYQQFPVSTAPSHQPTISYLQENASFNSRPTSNVADSHIPYTVGGATSAGVPSTGPSVLQQEVPSSYSSVTGKEAAVDQKDQLYKSLPLPISSMHEGQHQVQPSLPVHDGSISTIQPFAYENQGADPAADLSNQPLDFTPSFTHDQDPHVQSSYVAHHDSTGSVRGLGPVAPLPSTGSWAPTVATGAVYPPISPGLPSGHQHDPSVAIPSPISGHSGPSFGSFPGPNFQPTIPATSLSYGLGPGSTLHSAAGFPGDSYGVPSAAERPKKASVPNWLKEEIIKNASVITRSSLENAKEETQSLEDEGADRSYGKSDQADSKSIDTARSTEEEDEDENDDDAARTAAINQEIKRVLTEVLLKVTDELFDEIATRVLDEDDPTEVEQYTGTANHKVSLSPPEVTTPKTSAKVFVPIKAKELEAEDVSEKSSSSAPGNVLGLANYASDDEDDEIKSSSISNFRKNGALQQSITPKFSKDTNYAAENGSSPFEIGKNGKEIDFETGLSGTILVDSKNQSNAATSDLSEHKYSSKMISQARDVDKHVDCRKTAHTTDESGSRVTIEEKAADDTQIIATKLKSQEDGRHESKKGHSGKDNKDAGLGSRTDEKGDENRRKDDEMHLRKEKKEDQNGSREKMKERGDRSREKAKESESKKRTKLDSKEDRRELEKLHKSIAKEDDRKRGRTKDKEEDRSKCKPTSESSRHKRRRSSSTSSRGRNSKDKDSSDEASYDSRRKTHSRNRNLSPSPVRSRRRQVSRSPHSKHSQRRHSPSYSSLESTRRRRSRSKSPVRRHR